MRSLAEWRRSISSAATSHISRTSAPSLSLARSSASCRIIRWRDCGTKSSQPGAGPSSGFRRRLNTTRRNITPLSLKPPQPPTNNSGCRYVAMEIDAAQHVLLFVAAGALGNAPGMDGVGTRADFDPLLPLCDRPRAGAVDDDKQA